MDRHEHVQHEHTKLPKIFVNNFIGGIAWGLGASVGVSLLLALSGFVLSKINLIPVVGNFIAQLSMYLEQVKH